MKEREFSIGPGELLLSVGICAVWSAALWKPRGVGTAFAFFLGLFLGPIGIVLTLVLRRGASPTDPGNV